MTNEIMIHKKIRRGLDKIFDKYMLLLMSDYIVEYIKKDIMNFLSILLCTDCDIDKHLELELIPRIDGGLRMKFTHKDLLGQGIANLVYKATNDLKY